MRVQIDIRRPRWARLPRTWRMRALLTLVAAGIVAAPSAWAVHTFADVPTASPHHADVTAIFNARITTGCATGPPALYCPDQAVRRDQMGSFLRRGLGRAAGVGNTNVVELTGSFQNLATATISTGGTSGGTGFVLVTGTVSIAATPGAMANPTRVAVQISRDAGGTSNDHWETLHPSTGASPSGSVTVTAVFPVPTGTVQTFRLQGAIGFGAGPVSAWRSDLTAIYVPFGSTGGNTLGAEEAEGAPAAATPEGG